MVTCKLVGRLGNQMYIIAAAIGYAKKHGLEFHIPDSTQNNDVWIPELKHLKNKTYNPNLETVIVSESKHSFEELPFEESWKYKNIVLLGYFQSEKYFDNCKEDIIKAFKIKYYMRNNFVSIHVRRGDYLTLPDKHPVVTIDFIKEAVNIFMGKGYQWFLVTSDDLEWCITNINKYSLNCGNFIYSQGNTALGDMEMQSCCEHQIISNSSFSSWAAILNQNPNKICIAPKIWYGKGNSHLDTKDVYPKNSIII